MEDLLQTAGDAAALLEEMGYTAVARKRDGVVTLEYWQIVEGRSLLMRHTVERDGVGARALAALCDAQFRAAKG